jgi:hypothetical protein
VGPFPLCLLQPPPRPDHPGQYPALAPPRSHVPTRIGPAAGFPAVGPHGPGLHVSAPRLRRVAFGLGLDVTIAPYRPIMNSAPDQHLTTGLDLLAQVDAEASADPATRAQLHLLAAIAEGLHRPGLGRGQPATALSPASGNADSQPAKAPKSIDAWAKEAVTVLLIVVAIGFGLATWLMLYNTASRIEGPNWPTLSLSGHRVSVGGILGSIVTAGGFTAMVFARMNDRALPVPTPRLGVTTLFFGAFCVLLCTLDGRTPAEGVGRGLVPAVAIVIAMWVTRHPARRGTGATPDDSADS